MLKLFIIFTAAAVCYGAGSDRRSNYFLYTNKNQNQREQLACTGKFPKPAATFFDKKLNTTILIHGHGGNAGDAFNQIIRKEILLHRGNPGFNIIEVDWATDAKQSYSTASQRVTLIGRELSECIVWLSTGGLNFAQLHLVGFGLGAHVAGIAGRILITDVRIPVNRITGLDPSGSGWGTNSPRLRINDAHYVEVIHTDGSGLLANGIGTPIGTKDFYVNGGNNQPGCMTHTCSHNRAYEVFAASIFNDNLMGYACNSLTQMNLNTCRRDPLKMGDTHLSKSGFYNIYRINTRRSWPF